MLNTPDLDRCESLLHDMVVIDTRQPEGNEALLVDYIEKVFSPFDVEIERIDHSPERSSLVIRIPGKTSSGGVGFFGHLDTVAFGDESAWTFPPLGAEVVNGVMYGRGTADMKGGNVAMIEAALCLLESGTIPPKPVLLCFTADEEQDGTGARSMLDSKWVRAIEAGVFCEPTKERIAIRERGALWIGASFTGVQAHASDPDFAVNALDAAIDFYRAFCQAFDRGQYDPLLGHASVSLTQLHGGFMTNVIPGKANLELDIRLLPGQPTDDSFNLAQKIAEKLQNKEPRLKVELKVLNRNEANATPEDDPFIALVQQVCEACGSVPILGCPRFFTDAGRITPTLGIPFVIWGPGDDKEAHQIDEKIEIASVCRMAERYLELAKRFGD
ncbi:MAG TPA: M20 family metallopeptidase [Clostridiaceae bacterium]|nr:M20 family metallopeptidase [Clostridiaceae bacterium]